jgi:mono/diheme cytochrome c family protein
MSRLRRATAAIQWVVGVGAATAIVLLFSLDGAPDEAGVPLTTGTDEMIAEGGEIYRLRCASCHGDVGQGGQGPRLAGTVVVNYPDAADEIDIVTNGRRAMPPFASLLSDPEIAAVVTFTRFGLP